MTRLLPLITLGALALSLLGPLGTRFGLWSYRFGFLLIGVAALTAFVVAVLVLGHLVTGSHPAQRAGDLLALAVAAVTLAMPLNGIYRVSTVPMIHDITTDPDAPPPYVELVRQRGADQNPVDYPGAEVARAQRTAYPDIAPIILPMPPRQAFDHALALAQTAGWQVVATDPVAGRIEATDTTRWFGFTDDIVIRVQAHEDGARVDLRSMSRVGRSDLGVNAARIRGFSRRLEEIGAH